MAKIYLNIEADYVGDLKDALRGLLADPPLSNGGEPTTGETEPDEKPKAKRTSRKKKEEAPTEEPKAKEEPKPEAKEEKADDKPADPTFDDVTKALRALSEVDGDGLIDLLVDMDAKNEDGHPHIKGIPEAKYAEAIEKANALLEKAAKKGGVFG